MGAVDYSKLRGRTRELGYTQKEVAAYAKMREETYSIKLNGKGTFKQSEIMAIVQLLKIPPEEVSTYFFCTKSSEKIN